MKAGLNGRRRDNQTEDVSTKLAAALEPVPSRILAPCCYHWF